MERMPISKILVFLASAFSSHLLFGLSIEINPYQYSSEYTDTESGLQYLNARYYNPQIPRFISRDSYPLLSRYGYADGDPVNNVDPSGHSISKAGNQYFANTLGMAGFFIPFDIGITAYKAMGLENPLACTLSDITLSGLSSITSYAAENAYLHAPISKSGVIQNLTYGLLSQTFASLQEFATDAALKSMEVKLSHRFPWVDATSQLSYNFLGPLATNAIFGIHTNNWGNLLYTGISTPLYLALNYSFTRGLYKENFEMFDEHEPVNKDDTTNTFEDDDPVSSTTETSSISSNTISSNPLLESRNASSSTSSEGSMAEESLTKTQVFNRMRHISFWVVKPWGIKPFASYYGNSLVN